eukprot:7770560-Alexandrium_andersonii.AAC.1
MMGTDCQGLIRRQVDGAFLGLLGVSSKREGETGAAIWRIKDAPQWRAEDILSWFKDFGWVGVVILSPPKGRMGWLIRGRPNRGGGLECSDSAAQQASVYHE